MLLPKNISTQLISPTWLLKIEPKILQFSFQKLVSQNKLN